jgi:hypothetical protein
MLFALCIHCSPVPVTICFIQIEIQIMSPFFSQVRAPSMGDPIDSDPSFVARSY